MPASEGVIKYHLDHRRAPADADRHGFFTALNQWRDRLCALGLVGVDPQRYQGLGFGNLSHRLPGGHFLITGSQTGALTHLGPEHYAEVLEWNTAGNRLVSRGPSEPSSEALSHGAVYDAVPGCRCVIHVHSPEIWVNARSLGLLCTPPGVAYGTPEMADWIRRLAIQGEAEINSCISMGGHEDGIIVFGADQETAGKRLLKLLDCAEEKNKPGS